MQFTKSLADAYVRFGNKNLNDSDDTVSGFMLQQNLDYPFVTKVL